MGAHALQTRIDDDLRSSGLSFEYLQEHSIVRSATPEALSTFLKTADNTEGGLEFVYHDLEGKPLNYSRYKIYWRPLSGFAAKTKDERPKYIQKSDTLNHLYIPPMYDWESVLADPAISVVITEGEKKALALSLRDVPCVAVGGVNSTSNRKRGSADLSALKDLCKGGRTIHVVFDIDEGFTSMKPQVAQAAILLANTILEFGGVPRVVTLPSDGKKKCALDDWLLTIESSGLELLFEITKHSKMLDTASALYEEAAHYVYIAGSNSVGVIPTRDVIQVGDYRIGSGNKLIAIQELALKKVKGGSSVVSTELVVRQLSDAFLRWPARPQARGSNYEPGNAHYLTGRGEFNLWKGWAQEVPDHVVAEDVAPLWNAFVALYREDAQYMWNWFMYPIANPGKKMIVIPVIQAEKEGLGKSSIPSFFTKFVYGEGYGTPSNATTLNAMSLKDGRLEFMVQKQFLFLDDANDIHGNDVEALIKNIATTDSVRANPKYLRSYECKNIVNLLITTNRTMPFKVTREDRRLFFPHVSYDVLKSVWHSLHQWGAAGGGGKVVAYAQKLFDSASFDPYESARMTDKKLEIIGIARSSFENFLQELMQSAKDGLLRRELLTVRELKQLAEMEGEIKSGHDIGPMMVNRAAKIIGIETYGGSCYRVRIGASLETVYILNNSEKWQKEAPATVARIVQSSAIDKIRLPAQKMKTVPATVEKRAASRKY